MINLKLEGSTITIPEGTFIFTKTGKGKNCIKIGKTAKETAKNANKKIGCKYFK